MNFVNMTEFINLLMITLFSIFFILDNIVCNNIKTEKLHQIKFPPCKACKIFVDSVKRGIAKTSNGKYEGGDAAWEEAKLGSYAKSEVRLVEIQENVCSNVEEGKNQCYSLNEQYDSVIEDWWFNHQDEKPDFFEYFCIDTIKHCCLDFHYGPNCLPCSGYPNNICNNNGKCKGAGTRKGNGKCNCDVGYAGDNCDTCASTHYESYKDDQKFLCSKCHSSCGGSCTKAGSIGCNSCANGWIMDKEKGCLDVNECARENQVCGPLQFCVNTEGSFQCLECDRACAGCTGDGPDMCIDCANGYSLINNVCVDSEQEQRKEHVFITRYLTYFGLCVAICIIFQRNVLLAAIIGLAVGVYISVSEYILNTQPEIDTNNLAKTLRLEV